MMKGAIEMDDELFKKRAEDENGCSVTVPLKIPDGYMPRDEYKAALAEIERLIDSQPAKGTPEAEQLEKLAIRVQYYERLLTWEKVCQEPLFQFLKHDPTGRTILCLFGNGQISLGKAAEAITEKFCLGLEPALPKWKGSHDQI
jgi:hypothetical protein